MAHLAQPESFARSVGFALQRREFSPRCGRADQIGEHAGAARLVAAGDEILVHGEMGEYLRRLKCAHQAQRTALLDRHAVDRASGVTHLAGIGRQEAGHDVEQRALPRAVGSDQASDTAGLYGQVDCLEHLQTAKAVTHPRDFEQRAHLSSTLSLGLRLSTSRCNEPPKPAGRKITVAIRKAANNTAWMSPKPLKACGTIVMNSAPRTGPMIVRAPPSTASSKKLIARSMPKLSTLMKVT